MRKLVIFGFCLLVGLVITLGVMIAVPGVKETVIGALSDATKGASVVIGGYVQGFANIVSSSATNFIAYTAGWSLLVLTLTAVVYHSRERLPLVNRLNPKTSSSTVGGMTMQREPAEPEPAQKKEEIVQSASEKELLSRFLPKWAKPKPSVDITGDYTQAYKVKTKFGMLGPVASGKSTIAAALAYTCENLSSLVPDFYCHVLPTSTHILADANNLRLGHFPEKTDPYQPRAPEAGFLIEHGWKGKKVQVPVCDVAGEISDYIATKAQGYTAGQIIRQRMQSINQQVVETVKDCQGFIIALASPDALMFRESASTFDSDVYTHTVMNEIFEYRRRNKRSDPHVLVVLTKWDQVMKKAKDIQMDVYDESQDSMSKFLANGFPATNMLLKPLRDRGFVKYFRSWFKVKTREDGAPEYWPGTEKPIIDLIEDEQSYLRFRPSCSEQDYAEMVKYIGSFGQ